MLSGFPSKPRQSHSSAVDGAVTVGDDCCLSDASSGAFKGLKPPPSMAATRWRRPSSGPSANFLGLRSFLKRRTPKNSRAFRKVRCSYYRKSSPLDFVQVWCVSPPRRARARARSLSPHQRVHHLPMLAKQRLRAHLWILQRSVVAAPVLCSSIVVVAQQHGQMLKAFSFQNHQANRMLKCSNHDTLPKAISKRYSAP